MASAAAQRKPAAERQSCMALWTKRNRTAHGDRSHDAAGEAAGGVCGAHTADHTVKQTIITIQRQEAVRLGWTMAMISAKKASTISRTSRRGEKPPPRPGARTATTVMSFFD
jgi:hypothetical protein